MFTETLSMIPSSVELFFNKSVEFQVISQVVKNRSLTDLAAPFKGPFIFYKQAG